GWPPRAPPLGGSGGVVAAGRPGDAPAIQEALDARDVGWKIATGDDLVSWTGNARVLTDDHAPVDQLLQPSRTRTAR
ncbi:spermidine synthase, partial [Streptomyces anulatus]